MRIHLVRRNVFWLLFLLPLLASRVDAASLGSWQFTTPLQVPRYSFGLAATPTHLYALGGVTGTSCSLLTSVEVAPIQPDGRLGATVNRLGWALTQVCPCQAPLGRSAWRARQEYVFCVTSAVEELIDQGLLTRAKGFPFIWDAMTSPCGR
jgi:hypothetical protein